jgi:hypothetical protein
MIIIASKISQVVRYSKKAYQKKEQNVSPNL